MTTPETTINVVAIAGLYHAIAGPSQREQWHRLFGTYLMATPFTTAMSPTEVARKLADLNPGCTIVVERS